MKTYRIAAIGGDGIGPEVIEAGIEVLTSLAKALGTYAFQFERLPWSSEHYLKHGHYIPEGGLEKLKEFDAIFFGAVGSQKVPDHVSLWGLRIPICQGFDQYANVRPARVLPGVIGPLRPELGAGIDWVIVRENSEGEYAGVGGRAHRGLPIETATEVSLFTRVGVERIHRFAFELARKRPRKHLTLVTKSNAQRFGMVMWDEIFYEVAKDFPDVKHDRELVDAMTTRMVLKPASIDVMVATNLHADILSDLAAALSGSLGIAPTANLNPEREFPSMFEPIHGSAFDIVGRGIANPLATFWTAAMMLEHLGEARGAARLMKAIEAVTARKLFTPDLGGSAHTRDVTEAVKSAL
jgi:tartrate dehydrogenase/decarboxylase/D-malate dehydrogenase